MKVRDKPSLKRRLILAVLGSSLENKAPGFGLSEKAQVYMQESAENLNPELNYYMWLIQRICDSILRHMLMVLPGETSCISMFYVKSIAHT